MTIELCVLFYLWGAPKSVEPGEGIAICLSCYTFFLVFRNELLDEWKKKDKEDNN